MGGRLVGFRHVLMESVVGELQTHLNEAVGTEPLLLHEALAVGRVQHAHAHVVRLSHHNVPALVRVHAWFVHTGLVRNYMQTCTLSVRLENMR